MSQTLEPPVGRSVSIDQAAKLLNVSRRTIYYRIRNQRLQTIRTIGGSQRVLVASLYGLVEQVDLDDRVGYAPRSADH